MNTKQRIASIPLVGILILSLFVVLFLATRKRISKSTSSKKVAKHKVEASPEEALQYWTADKMHNAKPAPLPEVRSLDREKQSSQPSKQEDA